MNDPQHAIPSRYCAVELRPRLSGSPGVRSRRRNDRRSAPLTIQNNLGCRTTSRDTKPKLTITAHSNNTRETPLLSGLRGRRRYGRGHPRVPLVQPRGLQMRFRGREVGLHEGGERAVVRQIGRAGRVAAPERLAGLDRGEELLAVLGRRLEFGVLLADHLGRRHVRADEIRQPFCEGVAVRDGKLLEVGALLEALDLQRDLEAVGDGVFERGVAFRRERREQALRDDRAVVDDAAPRFEDGHLLIGRRLRDAPPDIGRRVCKGDVVVFENELDLGARRRRRDPVQRRVRQVRLGRLRGGRSSHASGNDRGGDASMTRDGPSRTLGLYCGERRTQLSGGDGSSRSAFVPSGSGIFFGCTGRSSPPGVRWP
mmetsp:Transcript_12268/g.49421  ORF Transcript_12268/g.49421 Transcript_12268/m.49421 type:complete len:370 (+) Transcript_12268:3-1112(+)